MDLEFLVQFLLLRHAHTTPAVAQWSDNVRQLGALAEHQVIEPAAADALIAAYLDVRSRLHRHVLADVKPQEAESEIIDQATFVQQQWSNWLC